MKKKLKKIKLKKKSYLLFSSIIYVIVVVLIALLGMGIWIPFDYCEVYYGFLNKYYIYIVVFFLLMIVSYLYYKFTKLLIYLFLTSLLPVSFFVIKRVLSDYHTEYMLENNICVVTIGVVKNKQYFKYSRYIDASFKVGKQKKIKGFKPYEKFNNLSIGDTILIVYLYKCYYINKVYSFTPTKSELKKCQNNCYLIHGKLIPIDKVDEKDLWKY